MALPYNDREIEADRTQEDIQASEARMNAAPNDRPYPDVAVANERRTGANFQIEDILKNIAAKECPPVSVSQGDIANFSWVNRDKAFPAPIQQLLLAWLKYSKVWRRTYWWLASFMIVSGVIASVVPDDYHVKTIAAAIATICGGLNTALRPDVQHRKYDEAFVVLNTAKHAYLTNPYVSLCEIGKAVAHGESIIHKSSA
jgi:hypothetical protein